MSDKKIISYRYTVYDMSNPNKPVDMWQYITLTQVPFIIKCEPIILEEK